MIAIVASTACKTNLPKLGIVSNSKKKRIKLILIKISTRWYNSVYKFKTSIYHLFQCYDPLKNSPPKLYLFSLIYLEGIQNNWCIM